MFSVKQIMFIVCALCSVVFSIEIIDVTNPCEQDITNVCGMPFPDTYQAIFDARICLKSSWFEVSAKCQSYLTIESPSIIEPCFAEINMLCRNVAAGENRIHTCLSKYSEKLTNECFAANELFATKA